MADSDLLRGLGLGSAAVLVVANMIGTGIFTTSGFIMESLNDPQALILCWLAGGMVALSGALCYGELGAMFPRAGGEYIFLREALGRPPAFLSGWISLIVGFSAPIAAAAIAFASYLFKTFPGWASSAPHLPFVELPWIVISPATLTAVLVIVAFSLLHRHSLYLGSRIQNVLTGFKVLVIVTFAAAGFFLGRGSATHLLQAPDFESVLSGEFAASLIFISFAYSGWNAAAYLGGEIKKPSRNIPLALLWGTLFVTILYLILNALFLYALSPKEMSGVLEVGAKSAISLFGYRAGRVFSLAITVCLLSVISAMIMAGPRVYYAMARDGLFFQWLGKTSETGKTPGPSIFLQAVIASVMVITSSFDMLLLYIGFTLSVFTTLTVAGMMLLRRKSPAVHRPYRTWGYPVTPLIFILMNVWIIIFCIRGNPAVALYGGGTILAGIMLYGAFSRQDNTGTKASSPPRGGHL